MANVSMNIQSPAQFLNGLIAGLQRDDNNTIEFAEVNGGALRVVSPDQVAQSLAPFIARDITTTRQSVAYASGAKWAIVSYRLLPGATAVTNQFAKFVVNAASDADANGKLATDGAFVALHQGDDYILSAPYGDPITRIDFVTEQAVGAEKTTLQILAGV